MASFDFDEKSGRYHIRFRWGRAFKRPLRLRNEAEARSVVALVDKTISNLKQGWLTIPEGADVGSFILSGGKVTGKPKPADTPDTTETAADTAQPAPLTLGGLLAFYDEHSPGHSKESTTRATEGYHRAHLLRHLGASFRLESLDLARMQEYARARSHEKWRGKGIGSRTILKEIATLRVLWNWGRRFKKADSIGLQVWGF